jgi:hypothetical protein
MLGTIGGVFGNGMKAARVADQVDAHVRTARGQVQNINMVAQQFDYVETQLQQIAQLVSQSGDAMAAMQFQTLQAQINNIQGQITNSLRLVDQELAAIDALTDKIQG